jgi:hypothetical protein
MKQLNWWRRSLVVAGCNFSPDRPHIRWIAGRLPQCSPIGEARPLLRARGDDRKLRQVLTSEQAARGEFHAANLPFAKLSRCFHAKAALNHFKRSAAQVAATALRIAAMASA